MSWRLSLDGDVESDQTPKTFYEELRVNYLLDEHLEISEYLFSGSKKEASLTSIAVHSSTKLNIINDGEFVPSLKIHG